MDWALCAYAGGRWWSWNGGKVEELSAVEIVEWGVRAEEILDCYVGRVVFVRVEEESVLVSSGIWFAGCYFMSVDVRWGVGHSVGENTKARTVKEVYKSLQ